MHWFEADFRSKETLKIKPQVRKHLSYKTESSIVIRGSLWPYRQAVKSPPFHGGFVGSNPARVTIKKYFQLWVK